MRSVVRFFALFLLTFVGSVEVVRTSVVPALQACVCGCGAPSDELCGCKGPEQPAVPPQPSKPCSEPSRGCSTTLATSSSLLTASKEVEESAKDPEPKPEPRPWPLRVAQQGGGIVVALLSITFGSWDNIPPAWRSPQRQAWLSVFRN